MNYDLENRAPCLLTLPDLLFEKIFGYLSFDEISSLRPVCYKFNEIIKSLLNRGFRRVERYHAKCLKEVKVQLPRRESERRDHLLAPLCNILSDMCCFIPGKVIDEIYRVLNFVQHTKTKFLTFANTKIQKPSDRLTNFEKLRANIILKELRDISSMAMEYFEEKILPSLKSPDVMSDANCSTAHLTITLPSYSPLSTPGSNNGSPSGYESTACMPSELFNTFQSQYSKGKNNIFSFKQQVKDLQTKLGDSCRKINEQELIIQEMNRVLTEQNNKFAESEVKIVELNKKVMDNEHKLNTLLNIVNHDDSLPYRLNNEPDNATGGVSSKLKKIHVDIPPSCSKAGRRDLAKKRKNQSIDEDQKSKKANFEDAGRN